MAGLQFSCVHFTENAYEDIADANGYECQEIQHDDDASYDEQYFHGCGSLCFALQI